MNESTKAKISREKFLHIECDVLITKGVSYDMLFGLNSYLAIGGNLTPNALRYKLFINDKERWGKIPLIKSTLKSNVKK